MEQYRRLRIHGDNIVECERTLFLLSNALNSDAKLFNESTMYKPVYELNTEKGVIIVELLSGYGRWGVSIADIVQNNGGQLREGADSYITEVFGDKEQILLGIEYCSALPAGNNAWQRNGRAYASVQAGIPYLYFAEIGGVELDENREPKAPRYPNPLVPFSYISVSLSKQALCLPVYLPHPSMSDRLWQKHKNVFGQEQALQIIRGIVFYESYGDAINILLAKDIELVKTLANDRRKKDTLKGADWTRWLNSNNSATWLTTRTTANWKKKVSAKVNVSATFRALLDGIQDLPCHGIGADELPMCIVPVEKKDAFTRLTNKLYPGNDFVINWDKPLAIIWITGFKPRGDDSRPDRGLPPLTRMLLNETANLLAIVYGPAKPATWRMFEDNPQRLKEENGLWQSIMNICDYVLVDSATSVKTLFYTTGRRELSRENNVVFNYMSSIPDFGEHDTDTAIHQIFSRNENLGVFECLCNPPGGDWSGISYFISENEEIRWTSLPRVSIVSSVGGKRPDHVIQVRSANGDTIYSIESKRTAKDLEDDIGIYLKVYVERLFDTPPTARRLKQKAWSAFSQTEVDIQVSRLISVGAFIYGNDAELGSELRRGRLDAMMAFEFRPDSCVVHVLATQDAESFVSLVKQITNRFKGLIVKVH